MEAWTVYDTSMMSERARKCYEADLRRVHAMLALCHTGDASAGGEPARAGNGEALILLEARWNRLLEELGRPSEAGDLDGAGWLDRLVNLTTRLELAPVDEITLSKPAFYTVAGHLEENDEGFMLHDSHGTPVRVTSAFEMDYDEVHVSNYEHEVQGHTWIPQADLPDTAAALFLYAQLRHGGVSAEQASLTVAEALGTGGGGHP